MIVITEREASTMTDKEIAEEVKTSKEVLTWPKAKLLVVKCNIKKRKSIIRASQACKRLSLLVMIEIERTTEEVNEMTKSARAPPSPMNNSTQTSKNSFLSMFPKKKQSLKERKKMQKSLQSHSMF